MSHLLLLAGTAEAREIAARLAGRAGLRVTASLAGTTRQPARMEVPVRIGGFGGDAGFEDYLAKNRITAVLDATHPFAHRVTTRTARICAKRGLPCAHLVRPEWQPEPGDKWVMLDRPAGLRKHLRGGERLFLAVGAGSLEGFEGIENVRLLCRRIDPPDGPFPLPNGEWVVGRPPFSVDDEKALFAMLGIDWLVVKNAGGDASRSKLDAARELGLPVAMLRRPPPPPGVVLDSVEAALAWVDAL